LEEPIIQVKKDKSLWLESSYLGRMQPGSIVNAGQFGEGSLVLNIRGGWQPRTKNELVKQILEKRNLFFFFLINKELNELKIRHFISVTTRIQVLRNPIIYRLRLLSIPFKLSKIQNNTEQL